MTELDFQAVLARSDLLFDRAQLEAAIDRMAADISQALKGQQPIYVTVLTGGLITAGMLAPRVDVDLDFDYVHVTRYHGGTSGGDLYWKARPRHDFKDRVILFVDDILDEGHTLEALKKYALEQGARAVYVAVLVRKDHDRCVPGIQADFVGLTVPDRYVFGFGMDYEEHGRSLFGIYAA
ncbi:MAG: hypoxanthine-guanine phosphoribosyltransferase [Xanthomonadales bacterium]|nr:Hypoxanthine-guanine phosphoribosyltransferase [Xanthomonadales bacterium]MCC6594396.1 hypoxanthine-guanine phosphoribosyltransferase [Xanthomonadales bacterium]MCE7932118.1 hypoxanthine-guanine phosphoribosyltransferase [Xanthomonadales bacterium PRO6]